MSIKAHTFLQVIFIGSETLYFCSMPDGRLLKPTRPVMSLDSTFLYRAFGSSGPNGQLWAAFTEVIQNVCTFVLPPLLCYLFLSIFTFPSSHFLCLAPTPTPTSPSLPSPPSPPSSPSLSLPPPSLPPLTC